MGNKEKRWGWKLYVDIGSEEASVDAPGWPLGKPLLQILSLQKGQGLLSPQPSSMYGRDPENC